MPSVYEILLESFWVLYGFPGSLSWLTRCLQTPTWPWPETSRSWWAPSPFRKGKFTYTHVSPPWPGAWDLVSEMSLFEKPAKRQMLLLSLYVWNFCTAAGFKGTSMREKSSRLDPKLSRNFRTLGSQCWTEDAQTMEPAKGWVGVCMQPRFLGWHRCYPDGIKQLRSASRELWIPYAPGALKIHR